MICPDGRCGLAVIVFRLGPLPIGPGEACISPAGFTGTFAVLEAVRKYYVVLERGA